MPNYYCIQCGLDLDDHDDSQLDRCLKKTRLIDGSKLD